MRWQFAYCGVGTTCGDGASCACPPSFKVPGPGRLSSGKLNPVVSDGCRWFFWDPTWTDAFGPFDTAVECVAACRAYAESL